MLTGGAVVNRPTIVLSTRYGISDNVDLGLGVHPTLFDQKIVGIDQQIAIALTGANTTGMTIMATARATEFVTVSGADASLLHALADFELTGSYPVSPTFRPYGGLGLGGAKVADGQFVPLAFLGGQFTLGSGLQLQADIGLAAPPTGVYIPGVDEHNLDAKWLGFLRIGATWIPGGGDSSPRRRGRVWPRQ